MDEIFESGISRSFSSGRGLVVAQSKAKRLVGPEQRYVNNNAHSLFGWMDNVCREREKDEETLLAMQLHVNRNSDLSRSGAVFAPRRESLKRKRYTPLVSSFVL